MFREVQEIFTEFAAGYRRPESVELPVFLTAVLARSNFAGGLYSRSGGRAALAGCRL